MLVLVVVLVLDLLACRTEKWARSFRSYSVQRSGAFLDYEHEHKHEHDF